jgi:hypothetical protein
MPGPPFSAVLENTALFIIKEKTAKGYTKMKK